MRCKVRTLQQCAFGCMGASKDAHSQRWRRWYMGCRQSTNTSQPTSIDTRPEESIHTGFLSMRQRMHAPRFRTSWTSLRLAAENRPRTLGFVGLVELPNSFTKPLAWEFGFIAIGRGKVAARCVAAVSDGSCSWRLSKSNCSWVESC